MKKIVIFFAVIAIASSKRLSDEQIQAISPLIVGGSPASAEQFPYQVAILMLKADDLDLCGGAWIKHKWVLTAASCFHMGYSIYTLIFGTADLFLNEANITNYLIPLSDIKIHPNYKKDTNVNNIALIYVANMPTDLMDSKYVRVIDLPTETEATTNLTAQNTLISGYGSRHGDKIQSVFSLQYTTFKIASNVVCKNFGDHTITNSTLCIDTRDGKSPCGDGGGPITIEIGSRKVLAGIVGPNIRRCGLGYPVVGESVFYHRKWIEETSGSSIIGLSVSLLATIIIMIILRNFF